MAERITSNCNLKIKSPLLPLNVLIWMILGLQNQLFSWLICRFGGCHDQPSNIYYQLNWLACQKYFCKPLFSVNLTFCTLGIRPGLVGHKNLGTRLFHSRLTALTKIVDIKIDSLIMTKWFRFDWGWGLQKYGIQMRSLELRASGRGKPSFLPTH